jgi:hypothetical protein
MSSRPLSAIDHWLLFSACLTVVLMDSAEDSQRP